jgi:hypothetical protein
MTNPHFDTKKFTLTAFIAFVTVFCILMLMMQWQGEFKPGDEDLRAIVTITRDEPASAIHMAGTTKLKLPDGLELVTRKSGMEEQLVNYLNDPSAVPGRNFDFDQLNFQSGNRELSNTSNVQIQHIAAILKSYPKVKIEINGTQEQAKAIAHALEEMNANASQIAAADDSEKKKHINVSLIVAEK